MAWKTETSLIQLLTDHIEQIKRDLNNTPNRELMERLISGYPYPRNFDKEPDVDENIYEVDSFNYDSRFYPSKIRNCKVYSFSRIKWLLLMSEKEKAPLTAQ